MSTLDFLLLAPPIIGGIRGAVKGFLHTLATLAGYVTGFLLAFFFYETLIEYIRQQWSIGSNFGLKMLVYALLFTAPVSVFRLLAKMLANALKWLSLGVFNTVLGFVAGAIKYLAILLSLVYLFKMLPFEQTAVYFESLQAKSTVFENYSKVLLWFE
jgi:membrane protein required for colicin V production